jgi:hypothetical protein
MQTAAGGMVKGFIAALRSADSVWFCVRVRRRCIGCRVLRGESLTMCILRRRLLAQCRLLAPAAC